ncbi:2-deoxy-D-gluconate 3-dehydrogenase [Clostridia bacterium]|nr:2-deoxy-D-gluconate 3-dehydrogenase [Clostridia bacterium]
MANVNEMFKLDGKVALITGSATGIGQAIAVGLAEAGADIAGVYNHSSPEKTKLLVEAAGKKYVPIQADLYDAETLPQVVDKVVSEFGKIDILVNNAGIGEPNNILEFDYQEYLRTVDLNQNALVILSAAAGKQMVAQGTGGRIINIASVACLASKPNRIGYTASKHAVVGITKSLAVDLSPHGVNVNCIAPGGTITDMLLKLNTQEFLDAAAEKLPIPRMGRVEDFKGVAVFFASEASGYITGQTIVVDGGMMIKIG